MLTKEQVQASQGYAQNERTAEIAQSIKRAVKTPSYLREAQYAADRAMRAAEQARAMRTRELLKWALIAGGAFVAYNAISGKPLLRNPLKRRRRRRGRRRR